MTTSPTTTINDEFLAELEQLAGKATPGPWEKALRAEDECEYSWLIQTVYANGWELGHIRSDVPEHDMNADYIAACNPATILALLQHVRELRVDAERYHKLRTVTPYRFKKIQDGAITDGGDVFYFHSEKFDEALDASSSGLVS